MNELDVPGITVNWAELRDTIQSTGVDFAINVVAAIVIFFVGRAIARLIAKGLRRLMRRQKADPILESFVCNLVYWALLAFVIVAAITQVGIQTTSLIALIGAAGLAVGLAMQGSLANFAAGVLIVLFRPYRVGDWVEAAGVAGFVEEVEILTTVLRTADNKRITVPNGQIMNGIITNYSANATRRVDMVFGVGYGDDIDKVRKAIQEVVDAEPRIHQEPACDIVVGELADSSVNFYVRPWVATADYWAVRFALTEAIKKRFNEVGISIPYPQRDVHIIQHEA
jgi:small conductance mechanosensitive channel